MIKSFIVTLIFSATTLMSSAQKNWEEKFNGYVVTEDNEIIKGYLKFESGEKWRGTKILLLQRPNDTPQVFYTSELKGYVHKKDTFRIFRNLQPFLDERKLIENAEARIVHRGKLTLYEIAELETRLTTTPGFNSGTLAGQNNSVQQTIVYLYVIRTAKGEMIGVKKDNFQSVMNELLTEAPEILLKVEKKELKYKHLKTIIEEYNKKFR